MMFMLNKVTECVFMLKTQAVSGPRHTHIPALMALLILTGSSQKQQPLCITHSFTGASASLTAVSNP